MCSCMFRVGEKSETGFQRPFGAELRSYFLVQSLVFPFTPSGKA